MQKTILSVLNNSEKPKPLPIWLMRQAGRYLPEYKEVRKQAGSFLNLCYTPELACEVTLQPIRKYAFDASILFADILLIPDALGQKVWFVEGEGPRLEPISSPDELTLDNLSQHMKPVYKTVSLLSERLPKETTLIGFAGSPWTVATYMIAGRGTPDQAPAHALKHIDIDAFQGIMDVIVEATINYLAAQVEHGAEVLQLFDSWAGSLDGDDFDRFCIAPNKAIINGLRTKGITTPIIGFPRGAKNRYVDFAVETGVQALSIDQNIALSSVITDLPDTVVSQGNLDPLCLIDGGQEMFSKIDEIIEATKDRRHIFNLGHGITQYTPPQNVSAMVNYIRSKG